MAMDQAETFEWLRERSNRLEAVEAELAAALEENSREYQRGRRDQEAAAAMQSPTWERDVVPLRRKLGEAMALLRKWAPRRIAFSPTHLEVETAQWLAANAATIEGKNIIKKGETDA